MVRGWILLIFHTDHTECRFVFPYHPLKRIGSMVHVLISLPCFGKSWNCSKSPSWKVRRMAFFHGGMSKLSLQWVVIQWWFYDISAIFPAKSKSTKKSENPLTKIIAQKRAKISHTSSPAIALGDSTNIQHPDNYSWCELQESYLEGWRMWWGLRFTERHQSLSILRTYPVIQWMKYFNYYSNRNIAMQKEWELCN